MRLLIAGMVAVWLCMWPSAAPAQEEPPASQQPQDQYFSGTITALDKAQVTVVRTVLGTESTTRTFAITPETRFEGKAKVKSRVTVRFVASDDGDRAVHILVRTNNKK